MEEKVVEITSTTKYKLYVFDIDPMGAVRTNRNDYIPWKLASGKGRPIVKQYLDYKENLKKIAKELRFEMPDSEYWIVFCKAIPQSKRKGKKWLKLINTPCTVKPDKDNYEKAFLDALCPQDSHIWDGRVTKLWSDQGKIEVYVPI